MTTIQSDHDIQMVICIVKDALLHRLGDEVELIFQYGSHVRGNAHQYSDVDISYVPAHESTWESITVMVGETLLDLYPMHWSKLERMADFRDPSASVLLHHRILYQRTEATGQRFQALASRLQALLQPAEQAGMLRTAMEIFDSSAHDYYLLRLQVNAGSQQGCWHHSQAILRTILHCLAVCNQACIDTRKIEQVLALPELPPGFEESVNQFLSATGPADLLAAVDAVLHTTRGFLLSRQQQTLRQETSFPVEFEAGYPELKRDLQGVMRACESQELFALRTSLLSLLREMSLGISKVMTGIEYSGFNSLAEYEQNLAALGFPPLLAYAAAGDFAGLYRQCLAFDQRLKEFLTERSIPLNTFATLQELQKIRDGNDRG